MKRKKTAAEARSPLVSMVKKEVMAWTWVVLAFLLINGAEFKLLPILDAVTLAIAEGYTLGTGTEPSKEKFAQAASLLQRYITYVRLMLLSGNTKSETATLLSDQATTLRGLVLALSL